MSPEPTERLVEELARDLAPVSPLPRLRTALVGVLGVWVIAFAAMVLFGSGGSAPAGMVSHADPRFLLMGAGFGVFAVGAMLRALAGAVPGREPTARIGARVSAFGLAAVACAGVWALLGGAAARGEVDLGGSLVCMSHAVMLGLLPMVGVALFLARAYVREPIVAAVFAATGTIALGVVAVHVSCQTGGWIHVVLGHAFAPFAVGCVLAVPIGLGLRAWARRTGA